MMAVLLWVVLIVYAFSAWTVLAELTWGGWHRRELAGPMPWWWVWAWPVVTAFLVALFPAAVAAVLIALIVKRR